MTNSAIATILIVDDNPTNLAVLFDYLRHNGFKVIIAQDGQSSLTRVQHIKPDIILLDVVMPGMDGFETYRRLKEHEALLDTPVIFMTGLADTIDEVKGLELGAVDYITKPIRVERVLARINTHLRLRQMQQELQRQNAELDAFAHTVAHDLHAPITTIMGYSELLYQDRARLDDEQQDKILKILWDTGQTAVNIVDELLLLATVSKRENIICYDLNMKRIVVQAIQRVKMLVEKYQGEIVVPKTWPIALGYSAWVEEIWVNYLSNGLKYGGHPPHLELGAAIQSNEMIRFWVKDDGAGILQDEQAILFTEFTRLNEVRAEGHGLGLSIVKRIVDKLGGEAGVESEPGRGSTFYFSLPAVKATANIH